MKAVILAGGFGTRISEETDNIPKPMVQIGNKPILWHIMKNYSAHGVNDFIICCGYKGYIIKEYFNNYFLHMSDLTIDLQDNSMKIHRERAEPWKITLVDTGDDSMTGGRLLRVADHLQGEKAFCLTYGDGVGNNNITESSCDRLSVCASWVIQKKTDWRVLCVETGLLSPRPALTFSIDISRS